MPAHRDVLERTLPLEVKDTIRALCAAMGVSYDRWHRVPRIAQPFEVLAVQTLAERLRREGMRRGVAFSLACARLGLRPETIRSRIHEDRLRAMGRARRRKKMLASPTTDDGRAA